MIGLSLPIAATALHLVSGIAETREIVLECNGSSMRINPMTGVVYAAPSQAYRSHAYVDAHFIIIHNPWLNGHILRIDRDTMTYSIWSARGEPRGSGTCITSPK
jgi:hypothetical protein